MPYGKAQRDLTWNLTQFWSPMFWGCQFGPKDYIAYTTGPGAT